MHNNPIKDAFGAYMGGYYASLSPTTRALEEYAARGLAQSIVWAPGRMIDQVDDMLASWRRNDNTGEPSSTAMLPVIIVAMGKDVTPSGPEYAQSVADPVPVIAPHDPQERVFELRKAQVDIRIQVAFIASDEPTARSLATQFLLWANAIPNRRFNAVYRFAGMNHYFPNVLEMPDIMAVASPTDQKNITILVADVTLHAAIPVFGMPGVADATDGKGSPVLPTTPPTFDPEDPPGFAVVREVTNTDDVQIIHSHVYGDAVTVQTEWHDGPATNGDNLTGP